MHDDAHAQPKRSFEVENTYDVEDSTPLPAWSLLPGVASVGEPEVRELDARYFDTADMELSRARVAIRRRTGGPDEGWHIKASAAEGRHESHWPLDDQDADSAAVPAAVVAAAAEWASGEFLPLARIRNRRTAYALRDAEGALIAEVVDDRVSARAERTGTETSWREWEVELGPAAPEDSSAFFARVDDLVASVGGRAAASDSKLGRALGR
ncbi:inorganic triphosphatase YgiF [Microbacterium endophyticum]|uniref:Inorganic triphosphatase YgiF n=1 Tax=Microbacterium endophyticum TaxID=1526412 RepID=A0A7W4YN46_9MICO|nr:CYTH domain-containing protein [Microbacterium endophyticum]MBB2976194.1 inorganic triphosphatase YgiF [Microbacterium endophyticum]NIK36491.1 inorganic triphosphatase YgiF [Microbacterium endophyticum]